MRVLAISLAVATGACGFAPSHASSAATGDGTPIGDANNGGADGDAPTELVDATLIDARPIDGCTTFSAQLDTCDAPQGGDLDLDGAYTFDTGSQKLTKNGVSITVTAEAVTTLTNHVEIDVLFVGTLTLEASTTLHATGTRPFAIVATGAITLDANAVIDVDDGGAGALAAADCPNPTGGQSDFRGGAGGGGGGNGAAGGTGGNGGQTTGGTAGPALAAQPTGPLGACGGARGGNGSSIGGVGGAGGGAIYVASAVGITIGGGAGFDAAGAGGKGGDASRRSGSAGGGGGGAGGMIWLDAPSIQNSGTLAANGGGGGEGSSFDKRGNDGTDGSFGLGRAPGGSGGSTGADGADGGSRQNPTGDSGSASAQSGGGGAGGGVGFIVIKSADANLGSNVSPAPM